MKTSLNNYPLLREVTDPESLRNVDQKNLPQLAEELREFMIHNISKSGGHLASSLGTVELSIAIHYIFNTPYDRLVWDVGHQSYPHKILTKRADKISDIRRKGGISGFPKREESQYDTFGVGHSSTSISALLGMAEASRIKGETDRKFVAVIGDGAMSAGQAFEAMNHAGDIRSNMTVILNDNDMSISENVGALSRYFAKILSGKFYSSIREGSKRVLQKMPKSLMDLARKAEEHVKGMVVPGTLFEELGFNYIGPIDGHDLPTLLQTLENIKTFDGPKLLHIITKKGKGYEPAENNPVSFHGITPFDPETGKVSPKSDGITYTEVFGKWLCEKASEDKKLIAITPAMKQGSGMVEFAEKFPERFYDVAIAEQHSVTIAAGMACEGMKPVLAIYSTFLQRGYDQLMHDVALQNLPVMFAIDRAGIVGADGPTHNGCFDISFIRCLPNITIMIPTSPSECKKMLDFGYSLNTPVAIRYPREKVNHDCQNSTATDIESGKGEIIRTGSEIALLVFGPLIEEAHKVADKHNYTLINMRFVKPLDKELLLSIAEHHKTLVTIEDNTIAGGAGSAVNECLAQNSCRNEIINLGIPDKYIEHGSRSEILTDLGLDAAGIEKAIKRSNKIY